MRIIKNHIFGKVRAWELGWAPLGRPLMTVHFYLVDGILIDTGQARLQADVLRILKDKGITHVLLTHHHEDHSGNARAIKEAFHVPILGHPESVKRMERPFKILPYQKYTWGNAEPLLMAPLPDVVETNTLQLHPVHTPGHSKDHTAYWEGRRGWLFSGDLYLADRIKYFRSDERIDEQIASLKRVLKLDFETLFCAHRPQPKGGKARISAKLQFLEDIYGNVADLRRSGMGPRAIMRKLGLKEDRRIKWLCFGDVSMRNMIRSVIVSIEGGSGEKQLGYKPSRGHLK